MLLYLLRHAHADRGAPDYSRPLSKKGIAQARQLGRALRQSHDFAPARILHSGLIRARETAEVFAQASELGDIEISELVGLAPEDDPKPLADRLTDSDSGVLLVGHCPHIDLLAACLLHPQVDLQILHFPKCALACLQLKQVDNEQRLWSLRWFLRPSLLSSGSTPGEATFC